MRGQSCDPCVQGRGKGEGGGLADRTEHAGAGSCTFAFQHTRHSGLAVPCPSPATQLLSWAFPSPAWDDYKPMVAQFAAEFISSAAPVPVSAATAPAGAQLDPVLLHCSHSLWSNFTFLYFHGTRDLNLEGLGTETRQAAQWLKRLVGDRGWAPDGLVFSAARTWTEASKARLAPLFPTVPGFTTPAPAPLSATGGTPAEVQALHQRTWAGCPERELVERVEKGGGDGPYYPVYPYRITSGYAANRIKVRAPVWSSAGAGRGHVALVTSGDAQCDDEFKRPSTRAATAYPWKACYMPSTEHSLLSPFGLSLTARLHPLCPALPLPRPATAVHDAARVGAAQHQGQLRRASGLRPEPQLRAGLPAARGRDAGVQPGGAAELLGMRYAACKCRSGAGGVTQPIQGGWKHSSKLMWYLPASPAGASASCRPASNGGTRTAPTT